jgi:hypothetical protein
MESVSGQIIAAVGIIGMGLIAVNVQTVMTAIKIAVPAVLGIGVPIVVYVPVVPL